MVQMELITLGILQHHQDIKLDVFVMKDNFLHRKKGY